MTTSQLAYACNGDVLPKSLRIKMATHEEIIAIGNKLFKKSSEKQSKVYEQQIVEREVNLLKELELKHKHDLEVIEKQHRKENEILEKHYIIIQDNALQEEAGRVKDIMNKETMKLLNDTVLVGQKKLDEALMKARANFDLEKEDAVKKTLIEQEVVTLQQKEILKKQNEEHIDLINKEWQEKLKIALDEQAKQLAVLVDNKKEDLRKESEKELEKELHNVELHHQSEVNDLNKVIEAKEMKNEELRNDITDLKEKVNYKIKCVEKVLQSFRIFIETTSGFYEGQAEFILKDLIPMAAFDEEC